MSGLWPDGHRFAFTIFDDTDWATLQTLRPIYELLAKLGMRTTKSVWVFPGGEEPVNPGLTCEDTEYLDWALSLQEQGFEIGLHNVAPGTLPRSKTQHGLDRFRALFGSRKIAHCNHVGCRQNIYWGSARLSGWRRLLYNLLTLRRPRHTSRGHIKDDPLFWGDLCREHVRYVRNFVFEELNTLQACPQMPYHDAAKPYVDFWFASADGASLPRFLKNFTVRNIDRLVDEGGLCIAYMHLAYKMAPGGRVNPEFQRRMEYIASRQGWFAPVSQVLDHLRHGAHPAERTLSRSNRASLETRWLRGKLLTGSS